MARPTLLEARRPGPALPALLREWGVEIPFKHCGALRLPVESTMKSICCSSGGTRLPDILEAHAALKSLRGWKEECSADRHRRIRIYNSPLFFEFVGAY